MPRHNARRWNPGFMGLCLMLAVLLMASPVLAQLTQDDIEAMRKQGEEEGWTFEVSLNPATQYPLEQLCGLVEPPNWREEGTFDMCNPKRDIPEAFDWRDVELPPVRNQGGCGSCWAFGTVGPLECAIKIQDGVVEDLSEQWLLSCNSSGWSCSGGWWAHDYHQFRTDPCDSTGAAMEEDYPYSGWDAPCACPVPHPYSIQSWAYIGPSGGMAGVTQMKQAMLDYGPIGVAIAVNGAFQAYSYGVFNGCTGTDINHAVVLVGWDDNQGSNGVWILRNSWGPGWGENGYMRIPYGCNLVGYAANYVNYTGGVTFEADVRSGWVPFDVNFTATSGLQVDTWTWDFGDGNAGSGPTPTHTYETPGMFTVGVEVDAGGDIRSRVRPNYIMALADSICADDVAGYRGTTVEVLVRARNNVPVRYIVIPVEYSGDLTLTLDSFSTAGCRTDYFETQTYIHDDPYVCHRTIKLVSSNFGTSPYLPPGEGDIVKLYFSLSHLAAYEQSTLINLAGYSGHDPEFSWPLLDWEPRVVSCSVSCAAMHGDLDGVPGITMGDLTALVDYLFASGPPPIPLEAGDVTCSDGTNVADVSYLVMYLFGGGPPPPPCF